MTALFSPSFLGLALATILLLSIVRGLARQFVFLALNLVFIWGFVLGPVSGAVTLLFVVAGYGLVHLAMRWRKAGLALGLTLLVAAFIYLRRYDFLEWALPDSLLMRMISTVGLSFLFFRIVHVMIDASGGRLGRLDFLTYVNYCLCLTTFLMGPIQRYQDFRDQWEGAKPSIEMTFEAYLDAALRVALGFVKAYVLAPIFADHALRPDADLLGLSFTGVVVQAYAFWVYLYLNFSGYCDIVIGIGSLLGVRPPENFNKPFLARNISDFWLRQHRSLSQWLTDYVFSPLYKAMLTTPRIGSHRLAAVNLSLMTTMLVSGLWHGTTISFLLFGLVHGLWFVVYRTWDELLTWRLGRQGVRRWRAKPMVRAGGVFLTFNATAFAFIFFRLSPDRVVQVLEHVFRI